MKSILEIVRNAPKRTSAILAVAAAVVTVPAILLAYGPDRPTYTVAKPADHVTFNSITNNPNIGDERNFVGIREKGTSTTWTDNMNVQAGKEYTVRVYVHNNAASELNKSGKGVAKDTTARVNLPTTTGKSIQVDGMISASNAAPKDVWDQAVFNSAENFNLAYVAGSLKYENNAFGPNGTTLPESIFTQTGAKLGYDKLDGNFPGCFKYAGYVSFTVKPQFAPKNEFTMSKQVRKTGATAWTESVTANPGDSVDYLVSYKNTGQVSQKDVVVRDTLPKGMDYVAGTSYLRNGANPDSLKISDNIVQPVGVNVGNYAPAAAAYVKFTAKVDAKDLECGTNKLINKARVVVDGGYKEDTAEVIVKTDECKPEVKKIEVCELETQKIISIEEKNFDSSKHSKNYADCKMTEVCNPDTGETIIVKESEKDNYAPVNSDECKDVVKETPNTPETPEELPQTGAAEVVAQLAGLFALTASGAYYMNSRRQA